MKCMTRIFMNKNLSNHLFADMNSIRMKFNLQAILLMAFLDNHYKSMMKISIKGDKMFQMNI
jgi:hypothetical protein